MKNLIKALGWGLFSATCLGVAVYLYVLSGQVFPACNDSQVKKSLENIFNKHEPSWTFIEASKINQMDFNKEKNIRICESTLIFRNSKPLHVQYEVTLEGKEDSYRVQILKRTET